MVTVPRVTTPTVEPAGFARPDQQFSRTDAANLFSAATGEGRQLAQLGAAGAKAGDVVFEIGLRGMKREADARLMEQERALSDTLRTQLYDPETGWLTRKGANAKGITGAAAKGLQDWTAPPLLTSDYEKQQWKQTYELRRKATMDAVSRHEAGQLYAASLAEQKALLENSTENANAAAAAGHGTLAVTHLQAGIEALKKNPQGLGKEALREAIENYRSKGHLGIVQRLMLRGTGVASAYLNRYGGQMEAADLSKAKKTLAAVAYTAAVRARAEGILQKYQDDAEGALTAVQAIKDPKQRAAVLARVRSGLAQHKEIAEARTNATFNSAWKQVLAAGNTRKTLEEILLASDMENLKPSQVSQLRAQLKAQQDGTPRRTPQDEYSRIMGLSDEEFLKAAKRSNNFFGYYARRWELSHIKDMQKRLKEIQKPTKGPKMLQPTFARLMRNRLATLGYGDNRRYPKKRANFMARGWDALQRFQEQHKRPPNAQEQRVIMDRLSALDTGEDDQPVGLKPPGYRVQVDPGEVEHKKIKTDYRGASDWDDRQRAWGKYHLLDPWEKPSESELARLRARYPTLSTLKLVDAWRASKKKPPIQWFK